MNCNNNFMYSVYILNRIMNEWGKILKRTAEI